MYGIIFKLFAITIGLLIVSYLLASALWKARRLDSRIQQFKKEQEEAEKQGRVSNPYAALAELYAEDAQSQNRPRPARRVRR
jgi:hypothetical protein